MLAGRRRYRLHPTRELAPDKSHLRPVSPWRVQRARASRGTACFAVYTPEVDVAQAVQQEQGMVHHIAEPGDVVTEMPGVSLVVQQPVYQCVIQYNGSGRPLQDAQRLWAHVGHSGWQDPMDVELFRSPADHCTWSGTYKLAASRLPQASHAEVQLVFKALMPWGHELWDNNNGNNWQIVVELAPHEGLVLSPAVSRSAVSSLLLKVEELKAKQLINQQQGGMLTHLAWQHDFSLMRLYDRIRHWVNDADISSALIRRCGLLRRPGLHVVHITAEMVPLAKVGGLGDVVTSLAKAHQASGTLVEIVMPKYDCCAYSSIHNLTLLKEVDVPWAGGLVTTGIWCGVVEGLPVYLLEPLPPHAFFWRGAFYGQSDDIERFLFFSRAALEFLLSTGKQPDVLHLHDWQSAAVAPLLNEQYRHRGLTRPRSLLTIHNIAFQGWMTPSLLEKVGLAPASLAHPDSMLDDSRPGFHPGTHDVNLMRGGVVYADKVTTVSPTYAQEVYQPEYGMGMQSVLGRHWQKFSGILNGIDHEMWDPAADPLIPARYSPADTTGKEVCKATLLQDLGLPYVPPADLGSNGGGSHGRPLLAIVSRLTQQKGLPLIIHGMRVALARGAQVVLLGSASEAAVTAQFEQMAWEYGAGGDARLILRYDETLAHRIYAAADCILIPSFFEPCGLTQLIALRYGTVPIVNSTGGLADTVRDVSDTNFPENERNGFVSRGRADVDVEGALHRALDSYYHGSSWWRHDLVPRCMRQDWSWSRSAQAYLDLYRSIAVPAY